MVEIGGLAAGGFLGAVVRYAVARFVSGRWPGQFPFGTLLVNLLGSFLLGWLVGSGLGANETTALLLGTGFLGAFTTFSTFKLESWTLFRQGLGKKGLLYTGVTYVLGIAAAWLGFCL